MLNRVLMPTLRQEEMIAMFVGMVGAAGRMMFVEHNEYSGL